MTDDARIARRRRKAELALRALVEHGTNKAAAEHLGISETTLRERVADYCSLNGYQTPAQAAYWLDRVPKQAQNLGLAELAP